MVPLKKRVARDQLKSTALRVADETLELVSQVKSAFYSLQASQQLLQQFRLIVDTNAASLDLAQRQHEAGNITDLALAQQQAVYSRSRLDVAITEAEIRRNREKLNRLLGLWGADTDWQISGELPEVPSSDVPMRALERLAISQRLDLQADYLQLTSQLKNLGLTRRAFLQKFFALSPERGMQFSRVSSQHNPNASNPMSSPGKFSFNLSKFPEGGLILVIVALGLLLAIFGGSVQLPKFQMTPDGKRERVFVTNPAGQRIPAFETVNKFFNARTIVQIAKDTSFFAIMAVGATVVIITGGIDLSVGSMYALASVCGALVLSPYGPSGGGVATGLGILATVAVGTLLGFFNGAMITGFNVHPFIITLGTMAIYRGIAFVQTSGQSIGGFPEAFRQFVRWEIVPDLSLVPLIVMILVTIIGGIFLSQSSIGRKIYAVGGNEIAAKYSGIRVGRVKLLAYTISGLVAGIASVLSLGYYGAGSSGDGQGYELNVIAASVVGGASLVGGKGTALGAFLGAVILQMISNGLVILNIPQNYSQIVIGLVVIAAVVLDQLNTWATKRRTLARTSSIKKKVVQESDTPVSLKPKIT